jgi:HK97 family phage major capsid protein
VIAGDLAKQLGLALDLAVFEGSGVDPEPLGIRLTPNVNALAMPGADGATPSSFDEIVKAVYAVQTANGPMATAAVMHPRDAQTFALLKDGMEQPLRRPEAIRDLPFLTTSQLNVARTVGESNDTSSIYVGDFAQVVVGFRPTVNVRMQVLEERYADTLSVGILAWLRCDVAVRRPEFLSVIGGVRPTS